MKTISEEKKELSTKFATQLEQFIDNNSTDPLSYVISEESIRRAYNLLEFFNKTKLVLSGNSSNSLFLTYYFF